MKQCFRFYFSSPKYDLAVSDVIHMTHIKHSAKPSALDARLLQNKQDVVTVSVMSVASLHVYQEQQ